MFRIHVWSIHIYSFNMELTMTLSKLACKQPIQRSLDLDAYTTFKPSTELSIAAAKTVGSDPQIIPSRFEEQMVKLWQQRGNVLSTGIRAEWMRLLSDCFQQALTANAKGRKPRVHAYAGQMGLGKSQAAQCALACLAAQFYQPMFTQANKSWGGILVVELIAQADEAAETINKIFQDLTGITEEQVAISKHSNNDVTFQDIERYPILVITHQAYANSLSRLHDGDKTTMASFARFKGGKRGLVVIDESFNPIEDYVLNSEDLNLLLGWLVQSRLDRELQHHYPQEYNILLGLRDAVEAVEVKERTVANENSTPEEIQDQVSITTKAFHALLEEHQVASVDLQGVYDHLIKNRLTGSSLSKTLRMSAANAEQKIRTILRGCDRLLVSWSYYMKSGANHSVNSANWLLPDDVGSLVILDGTSPVDGIYELFSDQLKRTTVDRTLRCYDNVSLMINRTKEGLGKSRTEQANNAEQRSFDLYQQLKEDIPRSAKVLVATHKGFRDYLQSQAEADPYFDRFEVAHWGAITGLNDWRDFDTAVVLSLPYRPENWAASSLMAKDGLETNIKHLLERRQHRSRIQELILTKAAAEVLQFLFRIRIRKIVDTKGSSLPCNLYVRVGQDVRGQLIEERIIQELPGATIKDWSIKRKQGQAKNTQTNAEEQTMFRFFKELPAGTTVSKQEVMEAFEMTTADWRSKWVLKLTDSRYDLHQRLARDLGVQVKKTGSGRYTRLSFFKP